MRFNHNHNSGRIMFIFFTKNVSKTCGLKCKAKQVIIKNRSISLKFLFTINSEYLLSKFIKLGASGALKFLLESKCASNRFPIYRTSQLISEEIANALFLISLFTVIIFKFSILQVISYP